MLAQTKSVPLQMHFLLCQLSLVGDCILSPIAISVSTSSQQARHIQRWEEWLGRQLLDVGHVLRVPLVTRNQQRSSYR